MVDYSVGDRVRILSMKQNEINRIKDDLRDKDLDLDRKGYVVPKGTYRTNTGRIKEKSLAFDTKNKSYSAGSDEVLGLAIAAGERRLVQSQVQEPVQEEPEYKERAVDNVMSKSNQGLGVTQYDTVKKNVFVEKNVDTFPSFQKTEDNQVSGIIYGRTPKGELSGLRYSYDKDYSREQNETFNNKIPINKKESFGNVYKRELGNVLKIPNQWVEGGSEISKNVFISGANEVLDFTFESKLIGLDSPLYSSISPRGKAAVRSDVSGLKRTVPTVYDVAESPRYLTSGQASIFFADLGGKGLKGEKISTSEIVSAGAYLLPFGIKGAEKIGGLIRFKVPFTLPESIQLGKLKISRDVVKVRQSLGMQDTTATDLVSKAWNTPLTISTNAGMFKTSFTVGGVIDKTSAYGFGGLAAYGLFSGKADLKEDVLRPLGFGIRGFSDVTRAEGFVKSLGKQKIEISRITNVKQLKEGGYGTYESLGLKQGSVKDEIDFFKRSPYVLTKGEMLDSKSGKLLSVWSANPSTFGKYYIIRAGSSEVAGKYGGPVLDLAFLKLPNRQAQGYSIGGLFSNAVSPSAERTAVKGFVPSSKSTNALKDEQAITDVLFPNEGFKVRADYLDAQATSNKLYGSGMTVVPHQKAELENLMTGASRLNSNKYYTTVPSEKQAKSYDYFFRKGYQESYTRVGKFDILKPSSYKNLYYYAKGYKRGQFYSYGINKGISIPIQERELSQLSAKSLSDDLFSSSSRIFEPSVSSRSSSSRVISLRGIGLSSRSSSSLSKSILSSRGSSSSSSTTSSRSSSSSSSKSSSNNSYSYLSRGSRNYYSSGSSSGSSSSSSFSSSRGSSSSSSITSSHLSFPKFNTNKNLKKVTKAFKNINFKTKYTPSVEAALFGVKGGRQDYFGGASSGLLLRPLSR